MLNMPFWDGHNLWNANLRKMPYLSIDSDWLNIMFYIGPQLKHYSQEKILKSVNYPSQDINSTMTEHKLC